MDDIAMLSVVYSSSDLYNGMHLNQDIEIQNLNDEKYTKKHFKCSKKLFWSFRNYRLL